MEKAVIEDASEKAVVAAQSDRWNEGTSCADHEPQRKFRFVTEHHPDVVCKHCGTCAFCEPTFQECWKVHLPKKGSTAATHACHGFVGLNQRLVLAARRTPGIFGKDPAVKKAYLAKLPKANDKRTGPVAAAGIRAGASAVDYKEPPLAEHDWIVKADDPIVQKNLKLLGNFNKLLTPTLLGRHLRKTCLTVMDMETPRTMSQVRG